MAFDVTYGDDWHAYHDFMSKRLHVVGTVTVRGGGVAVGLEPLEGNTGINPQMLALHLLFTVTAEDPPEQTVDFWLDWPDGGIDYTQVDIRTDDDTPSPGVLDVEDVH